MQPADQRTEQAQTLATTERDLDEVLRSLEAELRTESERRSEGDPRD